MYKLSFASVRGALSSTLMLTGNLGILAAFVIGTYSSYFATPMFAIVMNVLFVIMFSFFPETPLFLMKENKIRVCFVFCIFGDNFTINLID